MDGQTDGQMEEQTENLPILQDFVPYWGRYPATVQLQPKNCIKRGKGTADHMPLGDWFLGSGPDRGRSPVEWGDFLSVCPFVRPYVRPSPPRGPKSQPGRP